MSDAETKPVILGRDAILGAADLPSKTIPVPEWGGSVCLKSLTASERDAFEQSIHEDKKKKRINVRARLASLVLVDGAGKRMFGELDVELLGRKSGAALDRVFQAASEMNSLTEEDVKELEKNSEAAPTGG